MKEETIKVIVTLSDIINTITSSIVIHKDIGGVELEELEDKLNMKKLKTQMKLFKKIDELLMESEI